MKTLVYIPRMFTAEEFRELVDAIPEDFEEVSEEFWSYVKEKLEAVAPRIRCVYVDSMPKDEGEKPLRGESAIVKKLLKAGVELRPAGDPLLIEEAKAWLGMMRENPRKAVLELYEGCLSELNKCVVEVIEKTLGEGEMGVLFITPLLKIRFPEDMRIIRMFPFNPQDYLNRHLTRLRVER